jgi:hypothetical protein
LLGLFALHVLVGCLHNIIAWRYYPEHGDIWRLFASSLSDRHLLATHQFGQLLADNSRWTYFSHNSVTFILTFLNFFSFDNLYIDTLLFAFPVFLGNIALYRMFRRRFPADPLTAVTVFLLPSTLFWTSCIHREGVLYMALGFLFYFLDRRKFLSATLFFLLIYLLTPGRRRPPGPRPPGLVVHRKAPSPPPSLAIGRCLCRHPGDPVIHPQPVRLACQPPQPPTGRIPGPRRSLPTIPPHTRRLLE